MKKTSFNNGEEMSPVVVEKWVVLGLYVNCM